MTKRQREILTIMRDKRNSPDGELLYERGVGYIGKSKVASRTVFALIRMMAISADSFCKPGEGGLETYHINSTGIELLEDE